jgi:hypothetical protein
VDTKGKTSSEYCGDCSKAYKLGITSFVNFYFLFLFVCVFINYCYYFIYAEPTRRCLFIIICTICKQIVGFSVLNGRESPRTLFEICFMRFKTPPLRIVYDNACTASMFCCLRECKWFENTQFMIDRFHRFICFFQAHCSCFMCCVCCHSLMFNAHIH